MTYRLPCRHSYQEMYMPMKIMIYLVNAVKILQAVKLYTAQN